MSKEGKRNRSENEDLQNYNIQEENEDQDDPELSEINGRRK